MHLDESDRIRVEVQALTQNNPLSESDKRVVEELLLETAEVLDLVDADILVVQKRLSELPEHRPKVLLRIQGFRPGLTRRIHARVPHEVLAKIFRRCCDGEIDLPPQRSQEIWTIIQVCLRPHFTFRFSVSDHVLMAVIPHDCPSFSPHQKDVAWAHLTHLTVDGVPYPRSPTFSDNAYSS